jgi:hypothetical protein
MSAQAEIQTVPELGQPFAGGFYGGEIIIDEERFALIVAPKAEGEQLNLQYKKKSLDKADGTDSDDEGFYNTELNNNANHPAAQFCRSLQIGGYDDWYLPSRDELMTIWMALGPNRKRTPELFKQGGSEAFETTWYWSSTENAHHSSLAWLVNFVNGYQDFSNKNANFFSGVRAVRRLKI